MICWILSWMWDTGWESACRSLSITTRGLTEPGLTSTAQSHREDYTAYRQPGQRSKFKIWSIVSTEWVLFSHHPKDKKCKLNQLESWTVYTIDFCIRTLHSATLINTWILTLPRGVCFLYTKTTSKECKLFLFLFNLYSTRFYSLIVLVFFYF